MLHPLISTASPSLHRTPLVCEQPSQRCVACCVRQACIFGGLKESVLRQIHHRIDAVSLDPGQSLFSAQLPGTAVFIVRSGVVRIEKTDTQGDRRILRLAGRGDCLGPEAMLNQTYASNAVACTPVQACRIPRLQIEDLMRLQPDLAVTLMKRWQRTLDDADEWLTELTRGPVRQRMLRLLLKLCEYNEEITGLIWLPSRQEMGAMLDMTFETASRLVSALRREGILVPIDSRHARIEMDALLNALREASQATEDPG